MGLTGKRVLYIGPKFFSYENKIKKGLEDLGAVVDFFDDRPENDFMTKSFIRFNLKLFIKHKIDKYYETVFNFIKKKSYDFVFVVTPETLSYRELLTIKAMQKNARFILYMWDSFENKKNSLNILFLFDNVFSFDIRDCEKYSLNYLPLFYSNEYKKNGCSLSYKYDLSFIATAHSDRYKVAKNVETLIAEKKLSVYYYFYLPNKLIYFVRKIFKPVYSYGKMSDFEFSPLSHKHISDVFYESKVILDVNHPKQFGLTMRTFECLGAEKKLITTNKNIKNHDFYNPNNVFIIDRNDLKIDLNFFNIPYEPLDEDIYKKYSLSSWLKVIFMLD